jgi:hypothetical protein
VHAHLKFLAVLQPLCLPRVGVHAAALGYAQPRWSAAACCCKAHTAALSTPFCIASILLHVTVTNTVLRYGARTLPSASLTSRVANSQDSAGKLQQHSTAQQGALSFSKV